MMSSWFSYGNDSSQPSSHGNDPGYFGRREWSFTIQPTPNEEIYTDRKGRQQARGEQEERKALSDKREEQPGA